MAKKIDSKIYDIAKHLRDLNAKGNVKKFSSNDKDYATVSKIRKGISIRVHHLKDDRLILDLEITKNAETQYEDIVNNSVKAFKQLFPGMVSLELFTKAIDEKTVKRHMVDIKKKELGEIFDILDQSKVRFSNI